VLGLLYVDNHDAREAFTPTDLELLRAIANQATMFIKNHAFQQDLLREEVVRSNLLRQFSHKIADRLVYSKIRQRLGQFADRQFTIAQAVSTVSLNPARSVGMHDRGEIAHGLRADLVQVRMVGQHPVVRAVWREGVRVV